MRHYVSVIQRRGRRADYPCRAVFGRTVCRSGTGRGGIAGTGVSENQRNDLLFARIAVYLPVYASGAGTEPHSDDCGDYGIVYENVCGNHYGRMAGLCRGVYGKPACVAGSVHSAQYCLHCDIEKIDVVDRRER